MESLGLEPAASEGGRRLGQALARAVPARVAVPDPGPFAVHCPGCETGYGLPPGLVPPWGGRVRCPRCREVFAIGILAEAEESIRAVRDIDAGAWEQAVRDRSLWGEWGAPLLESYQTLRHRHGPDLAARAFRRALEAAAPGVPWMAPPTPPNPFEPLPEPGAATLFEKRREAHP